MTKKDELKLKIECFRNQITYYDKRYPADSEHRKEAEGHMAFFRRLIARAELEIEAI